MKSTSVYSWLIIFCSMIQVTSHSQAKNDVISKISIGMSYYQIKDCECQYEPKNGNPYYPSFGPIASYQAPLHNKFLIDFSAGYFQHTYLTTGIYDGAYQDSKQLTYSETTFKTHNYLLSGKLGISLKGSRLEIVPEIGFYYIRRRQFKGDVVKFTFEDVSREVYLGQIWPQTEPNIVKNFESYSSFNRWDAGAGSIGYTGFYSLNSHLLINFYTHLLSSSTWMKHYHSLIYFMQAGAGITYKIGKFDERNE